jgi:hypothetical protein
MYIFPNRDTLHLFSLENIIIFKKIIKISEKLEKKFDKLYD